MKLIMSIRKILSLNSFESIHSLRFNTTSISPTAKYKSATSCNPPVRPPQAAHLPKAAHAESQSKAFAMSAAPPHSIFERAGKQPDRVNTVAPTALVPHDKFSWT